MNLKFLNVFSLAITVSFAVPAFSYVENPDQDASRTGKVTRGMIVPKLETTKNGIRVTVDTFSQNPNDKIDLELQVILKGQNSYSGQTLQLIALKNPRSEKLFQNGKQLKFDVTLDDLNDALAKRGPKNQNLKIGPGTPLFVHAAWKAYGGNWSHQWGGPERGGLITIPGKAESSVDVTRPTGLDVAVDIDGNLANQFQVPNSKQGLKRGGQIRSRVEGEGKFQVYEEQLTELKAKLFELATDENKSREVLGENWSLKVEDRYMKRDKDGNLILAADGFPIPDPMVDTYYDNERADGAKKDMAIRYRWTEGNRTGAWNFKPGIGRSSPTGVMYRLEYGVDTTSDRPSAIARFADSVSALNPFQRIRELTGEKPSSFFKPAVKIIDHRYKFKLEHKNGLIVEISLDDATAENLRSNGKRKIRFGQLEMDIDHLATSSTTTMSVNNTNTYVGKGSKNLRDAFGDGEVKITGGVALHSESDLQNKGAIISKHKSDFRIATLAISRLRNNLLGDNWMPGAQKYAIAAEKLELIEQKDASKSVKDLRNKERTSIKTLLMKANEGDLTTYELSLISADLKAGTCKAIFGK